MKETHTTHTECSWHHSFMQYLFGICCSTALCRVLWGIHRGTKLQLCLPPGASNLLRRFTSSPVLMFPSIWSDIPLGEHSGLSLPPHLLLSWGEDVTALIGVFERRCWASVAQLSPPGLFESPVACIFIWDIFWSAPACLKSHRCRSSTEDCWLPVPLVMGLTLSGSGVQILGNSPKLCPRL